MYFCHHKYEQMKLNWKNIVGSALAITVILVFTSAVILFLAPKNEASAGWKFAGFNYQGWLSHFVILLISFFSLLIILLYLVKVKTIWNDFITRIPNFFNSKEFWISVAFVLIIFTGTSARIFPFKTIVQAGHFFSRQVTDTIPQVKDQAAMTINDVCDEFNDLTIDRAIDKLQNKNISVNSEDLTLGEIARNNNITAKEVYDYLAAGEKSVGSESDSAGLDKPVSERTVSDAAYELDISVNDVFNKLREKGINISDTAMTFKQIADQYNMQPIAVYGILKGNNVNTIPESEIEASKASFIKNAAKLTVDQMVSLINKKQGLNLKSQDLVQRLENNSIIVKNSGQIINDIAVTNRVDVQDVLSIMATGKKGSSVMQNQNKLKKQGLNDQRQGRMKQKAGMNRPQGNLKNQQKRPGGEKASRGGRVVGSLTLNDLAKRTNVDALELINALKKNGITASKTQTVDEIAKKSNKTQKEILKILRSTAN